MNLELSSNSVEEKDLFELYHTFLNMEELDYWIGNPSVELITGTIFFDKNQNFESNLIKSPLNEILEELETRNINSNILLVAPIPINKNFFEFADFIQKWENEILELRIIQTSLIKSYGVLICFYTIEGCQQFYSNFQGKPFNNLEPYLCLLKEVLDIQLVYERTQILRKEETKFLNKNYKKNHKLYQKINEGKTDPLAIFKFNLNQNFDEKKKKSNEKLFVMNLEQDSCPSCPICFEEMLNLSRLREKISPLKIIAKQSKSTEKIEFSPVLGILCGHFFHCKCLKKWNDETCPLCRYHQQPPATKFCDICGVYEDLWMCLICGFIGCGLQEQYEGHIIKHYESTKHIYSIEIETKLVYDHSKETYVHRLFQNSEDGKLLEINAFENEKDFQQTIDLIVAEYNNIMASQYETQKNYFEEEMKKVFNNHQKELIEKSKNLEKEKNIHAKYLLEIEELNKNKKEMENKFMEIKKDFEIDLKKKFEIDNENKVLSKKLEKINEAIKTNKEKINRERQEEIKCLKAQIRDLEAHFNIKEKFDFQLQNEEIENSKLIITDPIKKKPKKN